MKKIVVFGITFILLSPLFLLATPPPHPDLERRLKQEGQWENLVLQFKSWKEKREEAGPAPYRVNFSFSGPLGPGAVPADTLKVVVLYAAPSDRPPSADGLEVTRDELQAILFGPNPTGSMTDYYKEISYGQTVIVGTVFGPYTLPETNQYYTNNAYGRGAYPNNAQKFTQDAAAIADAEVDFSQFDWNNNGAVDGLFIIHTGFGAEWTGNPNDIWSHAWTFPNPMRDGKSLGSYAMQPEQQPGGPIEIGVFCHEAGHSLFGLPDLYDLDGSSSGIGEWCLMAGANYLNNSRTPGHLSAWCKKTVGWLSPIRLTANQNGAALPTVQFNPVVYRLWKHGTTGLEYFLVENRSKRGFDTYLPGPGGLLIWHIDEAVPNNSSEPRYRVSLEQADGLFHLENGFGRGDAGDPYPGSTDNRTFDENSNPASKDNNQQPTQAAVTNISSVDSVMTADLQVTYPVPFIQMNKSGFIFSAIYKGALPAAKNVTITNDGGGSLNWTALWNVGWLTVTPGSGTSPTTTNVYVTSTSVPPGTYIDTIQITSVDALNAPQKLWVNYQVTSVRGDLNRNGNRSPADLAILLNCVYVDQGGADCELLVADINCDGRLSPADTAILILVVFAAFAPPC